MFAFIEYDQFGVTTSKSTFTNRVDVLTFSRMVADRSAQWAIINEDTGAVVAVEVRDAKSKAHRIDQYLEVAA